MSTVFVHRSTELLEVRSTDWRPLVAFVAIVLLGVAYGVLFPDRTDYVGHYLAGAGATLMLLSVVVALAPGRPLVVTAGVAVAVLLGVGTEATIFRLAEFDPVDLANQSMGAVLAGIGLHDAERGGASTGLAFVGGFVLLIAGFFYAFA